MSNGPTSGFGLDFVILKSIFAVSRMCFIKYGWVIEKPELSGRRSISKPKYFSIDPSSINANCYGPCVIVSIKLAD